MPEFFKPQPNKIPVHVLFTEGKLGHRASALKELLEVTGARTAFAELKFVDPAQAVKNREEVRFDSDEGRCVVCVRLNALERCDQCKRLVHFSCGKMQESKRLLCPDCADTSKVVQGRAPNEEDPSDQAASGGFAEAARSEDPPLGVGPVRGRGAAELGRCSASARVFARSCSEW